MELGAVVITSLAQCQKVLARSGHEIAMQLQVDAALVGDQTDVALVLRCLRSVFAVFGHPRLEGGRCK